MATKFNSEKFKWSQQYEVYHNAQPECPPGVMIKGERMAHVGPGLCDFGFSWAFSTHDHWHLNVNKSFDEALAWVQSDESKFEYWWSDKHPLKEYSRFVDEVLGKV
jgi:hypothetical protein